LQKPITALYSPLTSLNGPVQELKEPLTGLRSDLSDLKLQLIELQAAVKRATSYILIAIILASLAIAIGMPIAVILVMSKLRHSLSYVTAWMNRMDHTTREQNLEKEFLVTKAGRDIS
jgi:hypothetical protein